MYTCFILYTLRHPCRPENTTNVLVEYYDVRTVHLVQFIIQTNRCTTYIYIYIYI